MNRLTKILIFSTIFLIPTYLIRFSVFSIPTNLLEILIYLTFVSYLFERPRINWKELHEKYKIYIFPVLLILSGLIFSTLINQNYREGFGIIKGWFFDPLIFSFVLINKISKIGIEKIMKTIFFSSAIVSLIALQYFFLGKMTYDGRLAAFHSSPNYLAMFLAPSIFIGLCLIKTSKLKIKNWLTIFSLLMISFVIYLTCSYTAWIAIILSLFLTQLIKERKINWKIMAVFILLLAIAITTQINNPKLKNISSERSSIESRMMIWKSSLKILEDNWIFGIGPGNFQNKYLDYQKYFLPYLEWAVPHPHNLYLAFWLQGGILGLGGFAILLFLWIKKALAEIKKQKNSLFLSVSLKIVFYILIHGIIDTTYWKNDLSLIFWIIIFSTGHLIQAHSKLGQNIPDYWSEKSTRQ